MRLLQLSFFLLMVLFQSCVSEFDLPIVHSSEDRVVLQCIIDQDSIIVCKVQNIDLELSEFQVVLTQDEIPLDTFVRVNDTNFESHLIISELAVDSDIRLAIYNGSKLLLNSSVLDFPTLPTISSSTLSDTIIVGQTSVNYHRTGEILINLNGVNFLATRIEMEVINIFSDTVQQNYNINYNFGLNCSESIFYLPSYTSIDVSCYDLSEIELKYQIRNLNLQDTIQNVQFEICNISKDLSEYFNSHPKISEGSDFFYSPDSTIDFNYENENILAIIAEKKCIKYLTQF